MHHNNKELTKITERTMNRLINEEIVMPSKYLETFAQEERSEPGAAEAPGRGNEAEAYRAVEKGWKASEEEVSELHGEIDALRDQLFSDDITESRNRLWIYKRKLDARQCFTDEGQIVSFKVTDYKAIVSEYDVHMGDRLQKMVCDYLVGYLKQNHLGFEIARFSRGHFLLFLGGMNSAEAEEQLVNMQNGASRYSFKHGHRIFGLAFDAVTIRYIRNEPFASVLDQLGQKRFKREVSTGGTAGRT